jgi:hypothetical protein
MERRSEEEMMKRRKLTQTITAAIMVALMHNPAAAQSDLLSANFLMPACRQWVNGQNNHNVGDFASGVCAGKIDALMTVSPVLHICLPPQATDGQAIQVVIQYIDARPARLHENFTLLAIEALQHAWPCEESQ